MTERTNDLEQRTRSRFSAGGHASAGLVGGTGSRGARHLHVQLILDQGADEYVVLPSADDADVLLQLFKSSAGAMFDRGRKVLLFTDISLS